MSFMDSYERLDNLCKTFPDYPKGISSYIEIMERSHQFQYKCPGWSSDYDKLKKYRYIRNQIAHDNGVYEDEMCDYGDEEWLENFRQRLLEQTDPLGQYYKSQRVSNQQSPRPTATPPRNTTPTPTRTPIACGACLALFGTAIFAVVWFLISL